jgi:hypothetical protein
MVAALAAVDAGAVTTGDLRPLLGIHDFCWIRCPLTSWIHGLPSLQKARLFESRMHNAT